MRRQILRSRITEWENIRNQYLKELCPGSLLIPRRRRLAGFHNLAQLKPVRNQMCARVPQKSGLKTGLGAHQKRRALRGQAIFPICAFGQNT